VIPREKLLKTIGILKKPLFNYSATKISVRLFCGQIAGTNYLNRKPAAFPGAVFPPATVQKLSKNRLCKN